MRSCDKKESARERVDGGKRSDEKQEIVGRRNNERTIKGWRGEDMVRGLYKVMIEADKEKYETEEIYKDRERKIR